MVDAGREILRQWDAHFTPAEEAVALVPDPVDVDFGVGGASPAHVNSEPDGSYIAHLREERRAAYEEAKRPVIDDDGNQSNTTVTLIHGAWEQWWSQHINSVHTSITDINDRNCVGGTT